MTCSPLSRPRFFRRLTSTCAAVLAAAVLAAVVLPMACTDATGPLQGRFAGLYRLVEVNGSPVPVSGPILGAEYNLPNCPSMIVTGELSLSPSIGTRDPIYSWDLLAEATCPGEPNVARRMIRGDFGNWAATGRAIMFRPSNGDPEYSVRPEQMTGSDSMYVTVDRSGQRYRFLRPPRPNAPSGYLSVSIETAQGTRVGGALIDIVTPDGFFLSYGTTQYAALTTVGPPGDWLVSVRPPAGYRFASGQVNPRTVRVISAETVLTRFIVEPTP